MPLAILYNIRVGVANAHDWVCKLPLLACSINPCVYCKGELQTKMCVHFTHRLIQTGYLGIHVLGLAALLPNHQYCLITLQFVTKAGFSLQSVVSSYRTTGNIRICANSRVVLSGLH